MHLKMLEDLERLSLLLKAKESSKRNIKEYLSLDKYFFDEPISIIIVSEYFKREQSFYSLKNDEDLSN